MEGQRRLARRAECCKSRSELAKNQGTLVRFGERPSPSQCHDSVAHETTDDSVALPSSNRGGSTGSAAGGSAVAKRPGLISLLLLSAWCGLVAGLLEVGTIVLRKQTVRPESSLRDEPPLRLADPGDEPRRFPGAGIVRVDRRLGLAATRSLAACAASCARSRSLPMFLIAFPRIYTSGLAGRGAGGRRTARSAS